jgi:2',3'-cyclic-nucleotide 2'-phosphodiesterase (5'-nucleotidase family)
MKGKTLIHKSGQNAYWLGRVDMRVTLTTSGDRRRISVSFGWQMISNMDDTVPADQEFTKLIRKWIPLEEELAASGMVMVLLSHDLDSRTALCRQQQCTFGCMVSDALREFFHTDIGVINGRRKARIVYVCLCVYVDVGIYVDVCVLTMYLYTCVYASECVYLCVSMFPCAYEFCVR